MIPAPFDYHRPGTLDEAIGLLARYGRRQGALGRHEPAAAAQAAPGLVRPISSTSAASPGSSTSRRRRAGFANRRRHARRPALEQSRSSRREISASRGHGAADRRPAGAQPRHRRRQPRARRSGQRSSRPMLALGAEVVARGPRASARSPSNKFYTDLFVTALAPDEILTEIRIPMPPPRSGGAYASSSARSATSPPRPRPCRSRWPHGAVERAGIALTNAGPDADRGGRGRAVPAGKKPDAKTIAEAARLAAQGGVAERRPARLGRIQARDGARAGQARAL